jgi:hypothetical protein
MPRDGLARRPFAGRVAERIETLASGISIRRWRAYSIGAPTRSADRRDSSIGDPNPASSIAEAANGARDKVECDCRRISI